MTNAAASCSQEKRHSEMLSHVKRAEDWTNTVTYREVIKQLGQSLPCFVM